MRFLFLILPGIFLCGTLRGTDTIPVFRFTDELQGKIAIDEYLGIVVDKNENYDIERILKAGDITYSSGDVDFDVKGGITLWTRIQLSNESSEPKHELLTFCNLADSIWIFTVENGHVIEEKATGRAFRIPAKYLPSTYNYSPVSLDVGQKKTFYFKIKFITQVGQKHLFHLSTQPTKMVADKLINRYAWHGFYAGFMILFGLVSLFMLLMFREKVFVYFAMIMFFFALYFLDFGGVLGVLLPVGALKYEHAILQLIISGLIASLFLFFKEYISLPAQFPKYYRFYLIATIVTASLAHLLKLFINDPYLIASLSNLFIVFWTIITIIPIVRLTIKQDKSARILLISIGSLFVGTLALLLKLLNVRTSDILTIYGFQMSTIIFSGILFYGLFTKINSIREAKQRFEALDKIKSRFFANISHEFRTPLTLIMGPVKQVMEKTEAPKNRSLLKTAHTNADRLLQLINQMLDLSKLEAGKMKLQTQEQNIAELLKGIVMSFDSLADRKHIRLQFISQNENIPLFIDKDKLEKIFYNLLSNAFKFTEEYGEVAVMIIEHKKTVEIIVRDNGIGISREGLVNIFNRFFQEEEDMPVIKGTGIGLALVKELVELHSGTITVESEVNKGTSFNIHLPKGKLHLKEEEILTIESNNFIEKGAQPGKLQDLDNFDSNDLEVSSAIEKGIIDHRPIVLIVEDNRDVRAYIRQHLDEEYQIIEAVNGQDGIEKAIKYLPDLVVSDVMMPKKNGYEVCSFMKKDVRTSHIPVIMLTAKAAREEKMKGLEFGADDYLVKPFDTNELEVRIRNLINIRKQLQKQFNSGPFPNTSKLSNNSLDKSFLEKVCNTIETHISNGNFGVDMLSSEIGMSRGHLNRKLKALTDQSANKFIQSYRLEKALKKLRQKTGNVSEVAFETGFSSTAYFVKCFREKYGKTPGSILQE